MQVGDTIEGQRSGEEFSVDKDCPLGIEFMVVGELFGKPGKLRARLARAEKRRHNYTVAVDKGAEVKPGNRGKTTAEGSGTAGHD